jgi:hypothetical protein
MLYNRRKGIVRIERGDMLNFVNISSLGKILLANQ